MGFLCLKNLVNLIIAETFTWIHLGWPKAPQLSAQGTTGKATLNRTPTPQGSGVSDKVYHGDVRVYLHLFAMCQQVWLLPEFWVTWLNVLWQDIRTHDSIMVSHGNVAQFQVSTKQWETHLRHLEFGDLLWSRNQLEGRREDCFWYQIKNHIAGEIRLFELLILLTIHDGFVHAGITWHRVLWWANKHIQKWDKFRPYLKPTGSMYGIYANIGGILMVHVTIYIYIYHTWILWESEDTTGFAHDSSEWSVSGWH